MSLLISGIRLPFTESSQVAVEKALQQLGIVPSDAIQAHVYRTSVDARRGKIDRVYTVQLDGVEQEKVFAERLQTPSVRYKENAIFQPQFGWKTLEHRPVIVGLGPAGLFAAYVLAKYGYEPIVLERGDDIDTRDGKVDAFWKQQQFDARSNIQFGEGGAGAYSDGKLTTRINDSLCEEVLKTFIAHGAPKEISTQAKPHIGTDILKSVVRSIRNSVIQYGGDVHFRTALTSIRVQDGVLRGIFAQGMETACDVAVLALGHSARDTVVQIHQDGVAIEPKAFSVGVRIEHLQSEMDKALYGKYAGHPMLPPAEYALSVKRDNRACYSFCMCPGGLVVAAQSEENTIVTNGMSYHARNGRNANAAIAVSVDPTDFADGTPFGGIAFQREIERKAFAHTNSYQAPAQLVGDFLENKPSKKLGAVKPTYPIAVALGSVDGCLPDFVTQHLQSGLQSFAQKNSAFAAKDAVLTAPETRTSSPLRLPRQGSGSSTQVQGIIPCGEGAGYAGGIMSAAVDGIKVAQAIMQEYRPRKIME